MSPNRFFQHRSGGLTRHADKRAAQRRITRRAIELVRAYGRREAARDGFHLTTDAMPCPPGVESRAWSAARGVVVVETRERTVLTVYRRRNE
jgi:hypothetical protein